MTDLRTHWMRTVHEALCGLSAKRLMLGERIIGGECATADVTCHGCRAVLRLAAMDAASGGPDDLRTLAQAVVDAGPTECIWPVNAPTSALLKAMMPEVGDKASPLYDTARAILAALNAERKAGWEAGYDEGINDGMTK